MAGTEGGKPKQEAAFGGRDVPAGGVGLVFELVGAGRHVLLDRCRIWASKREQSTNWRLAASRSCLIRSAAGGQLVSSVCHHMLNSG